MLMNIAVTAASGKVGTALLAAAQARNLRLRALVREPTRLGTTVADVVRFDFADGSTHARALEGVDTLFIISPADAQQVERERAVIDAARASGVGHVVRLSGAGAGAEHAGNRFSDQHRALESYLASSGMATTILRATFFMENMLGIAAAIAAGSYPAPTADARMGQVAVADIVDVALAVLVDPAVHRGATYTLTGPAAYTGEELAAALSEAAGHRVRYVDVPEDAFRQRLAGAGLPPFMVDGLIDAYRLVRSGGTAAISDDVRRVTGKTPRDFGNWARAHAARFRAAEATATT
jgi:uncharacterized protein YbjT (DUF2867 family)